MSNGASLPQKIKDLVTVAVNKWMPFVKIDNVEVLTSDDDVAIAPNQVKININFSVGQISGKLTQSITA